MASKRGRGSGGGGDVYWEETDSRGVSGKEGGMVGGGGMGGLSGRDEGMLGESRKNNPVAKKSVGDRRISRLISVSEGRGGSVDIHTKQQRQRVDSKVDFSFKEIPQKIGM